MEPSPPSRLLLIDDHRLFNDGLKSLLDAQTDLTVCGQVFTAADALAAVHRLAPQLVLLDVNLQGVSGIDLGSQLIHNFAGLYVILLTMYNQPKLLDEARRAGLHGYLLKDATTDLLLKGIRTVLNGGKFFALNESGHFIDRFGDDFARRLSLTFREVEIIRLICQGLSSEQIADQLTLSVETIKTHRKNIHFKLGISKVADLIQFAIKQGL
ncbi:response regulator transcription factor [Spirosoma sp. BT702]|uniref:Response regulator transcription factor n=1 Tax=Spirosoma profusum TaxID=2771354 RepID=A0A926XWD8_9BACT|nr:response regulator transcription factor [Spirosoma profusum]MBD2701754.1 response regulator transcription factor [Spirosoma profusum]